MNPEALFDLTLRNISGYEFHSLMTLLQAECDRLEAEHLAREKETGTREGARPIFVAYVNLRRKLHDQESLLHTNRRQAPVDRSRPNGNHADN